MTFSGELIITDCNEEEAKISGKKRHIEKTILRFCALPGLKTALFATERIFEMASTL